MPFQTYNDLKSAVTDWLNRTGDTAIENRVPDWIALCEARIRRQQEWFVQYYSLANSGLPLDITANPQELPTYVKNIEAMWAATGAYKHPIEVVTPEAWRTLTVGNADAQGIPRKAVIVPQMDNWQVDPDGTGPIVKQGSRVFLWPRPLIDGSFKIDFKYLRDVDPMTASAVNGLYIRHPDLYLYGTLCESAPFLQHDERLGLWESRYDNAVKEINVERERAEYSASKKSVNLPFTLG